MIEPTGCTPLVSWALFGAGISVGVAFGFYLRDVLIRARFESRPVREPASTQGTEEG